MSDPHYHPLDDEFPVSGLGPPSSFFYFGWSK